MSRINPGGHYSNSTGEYTCPKTGVYLFSFSIIGYEIKQGPLHSVASAQLYRDGDIVSAVLYQNFNWEETSLTISHTDIVACQSGQRVWLQSGFQKTSLGGGFGTGFGGVLLYTTE